MSTGHEPTPTAPEAVAVPPAESSDAAPVAAPGAEPPIPDRVYRLSIDQYNTMVEAGCFQTGDLVQPKLELLEGVLVTMSPTFPPHRRIVDKLMYWAVDTFDRDRYRVSVQNPVEVHPSLSEPEPDILIYQETTDLRHPNEKDVRLLIEVADSSLHHDLTQKARIYARGGVPEYWVVDIANRKLHTHRHPQGDAYTELHVIAAAGEATPLVAESAVLRLAELFAVLDQA